MRSDSSLMRLVLDSLIALMLVGILGAVLVHYRQQQQRLETVRFVHRSLADLHEQATYHRALATAAHADDTEAIARRKQAPDDAPFPRHISPNWFGPKLPLNVLADTRQPWIDLAPKDDLSAHPPDPVLRGMGQAGFWYNPSRGIFRARVPPQLSEQATLNLYNRVNGTALMALPQDESAQRQPRSHRLTPDIARRQSIRDQASANTIDKTLESVRQMAADIGSSAAALLSAGPRGAHAAEASSTSDSEADASRKANESRRKEAEMVQRARDVLGDVDTRKTNASPDDDNATSDHQPGTSMSGRSTLINSPRHRRRSD